MGRATRTTKKEDADKKSKDSKVENTRKSVEKSTRAESSKRPLVDETSKSTDKSSKDSPKSRKRQRLEEAKQLDAYLNGANNNAKPVEQVGEGKGISSPSQAEGVEGIQLRIDTNEDFNNFPLNGDSSSGEEMDDPVPKNSSRQNDIECLSSTASGVGSSLQDMQSNFEQNPVFAEFVKGLVGRELKNLGIKKDENQSSSSNKRTPVSKRKRDKGNNIDLINKSPSEPTLYKSALQKRDDANVGNQGLDFINQYINQIRSNLSISEAKASEDEDEFQKTVNELAKKELENKKKEQARKDAAELILEAEKNKAMIAGPLKGMEFDKIDNQLQINEVQNLHEADRLDRLERLVLASHEQMRELKVATYIDPDENFSHATCHVDEQNEERAKVGKWVKIVKFLPKLDYVEEDKKTELINRNGFSFWISASSAKTEQKINSYAKWEQAFRAYASIFIKHNPQRSTEIMQYIQTINQASQSYQWHNVAKYDMLFRRLMDQNPERSWGKTYLHGYVTSMKNPISFNNNNSHNFNGKGSRSGGNNNSSNVPGGSNICWRYNRNKCNLGPNCKYEHRCSFCGSPDHIFFGCPKRTLRKGNNKNNGNNSGQNNAGQNGNGNTNVTTTNTNANTTNN